MKKRLKEIVESDEILAGRVFNLFIIVLILLSVISISLITLPDLDESTVRILEIFEILVVVVFTVEYILRIYVADKKLSYIFSFYGLIDLIAILPFYISTGLDLRALRIFRVFRLLRIFKLARYSEAASLLMRVFKSIRRELTVFMFVSICILYVAAIGIYYFENPAQPEKFSSVFHSLWWSVSTFTLLGYGDVYPVTIGGRIFTFFVLITGIAMIALPTGLVAAALRNEVDIGPEK